HERGARRYAPPHRAFLAISAISPPQCCPVSSVTDLQQVHEWFLQRGLPLVLTRRVRSRDLIDRSAPMVSGVGAITAVPMRLAGVNGTEPDYGYALRLGIIAAVLAAAPFALYLLPRSGTRLGEAG